MGADQPRGVIVEVARSIEPIEEEWEDLADRTGALPFLRPGWMTAWWRAFGVGTPEIVTIRRDGLLVGLAALYRPSSKAAPHNTAPLPRRSRSGTLRGMGNWHTGDFSLLADEQELLDALAAAAISRANLLLSIPFLDPRSESARSVRAAANGAGFRVLLERLPPSPYVSIDGDWSDYEQRLATKMVSDLRRRRRRLEAEGQVVVEVLSGKERLDELLEEGFRIEASGWKAGEGSAIESHPATARFYRDIATWAMKRRALRLGFLRLDGRPLAFQYGIEENGTYHFLKGGYDPAYRRFAPAKLLLHAMLGRAFSIGLKRYDFMGGDEPWKLDWTSTCRERAVLHAFAPSWNGVIESIAYVRLRPLRARFRDAVQTYRSSV